MFTIGLPYLTIKIAEKNHWSGDWEMEYFVIIPAAGKGTRMGAKENKLFLPINHLPVIAHTINVFEKDKWCKGIVLVVNPRDKEKMEHLIDQYHFQKIFSIVNGGKERQYSVFEGLKELEKFPDHIVLIHDGARPLLKEKSIHRLVEKVQETGSAILAVPVKDTIKVVGDGKVKKTLDRTNLMSIQTPQAFKISSIIQAHQRAVQEGIVATDDAALMELLGEEITIVEGDYENIKITTAEDLLLAQLLLSKN